MNPKETQESLGQLVASDSGSLLPRWDTFQDIMQVCTMVSQSYIVPEAYRGKPADIFVAAQYGREIGLPFMTAIQNIAIINGRPALPSNIKLAMVRSKKLLKSFKEASTEEIQRTGKAWCEMLRVGETAPMRHTFDVEDAKRAGLWERRSQTGAPTPWVTYKFRMLQLKPRDMVLRDLFGDVFFGMVSIEEAREIQWAEEDGSAEAQIAAASQPGTKGAAIAQAPKPALQQPSPQPPATPKPAPKPATKPPQKAPGKAPGKPEPQSAEAPKPAPVPEPEPEEPAEPQTDPQPEPEPEPDSGTTGAQGKLDVRGNSALISLVEGSCEQLRRLPGGGPKLMRLWQLYKMPPAKFGKVSPSTFLMEPALAMFGNAVQKEIMAYQTPK